MLILLHSTLSLSPQSALRKAFADRFEAAGATATFITVAQNTKWTGLDTMYVADFGSLLSFSAHEKSHFGIIVLILFSLFFPAVC